MLQLPGYVSIGLISYVPARIVSALMGPLGLIIIRLSPYNALLSSFSFPLTTFTPFLSELFLSLKLRQDENGRPIYSTAECR